MCEQRQHEHLGLSSSSSHAGQQSVPLANVPPPSPSATSNCSSLDFIKSIMTHPGMSAVPSTSSIISSRGTTSAGTGGSSAPLAAIFRPKSKTALAGFCSRLPGASGQFTRFLLARANGKRVKQQDGGHKNGQESRAAAPQQDPCALVHHFSQPPDKPTLPMKTDKRPLRDQENSTPNSPSKKRNAVDALDGKQQHDIGHSSDKIIDLFDMSSDKEFVDLTGWQCPYLDCHDMNSSMVTCCQNCGRHTSRENLKLIEALERAGS